MNRTWPLRPSIAAMLAASVDRDLGEISSLPRGGVWVKVLFNACDIEGSDYTGGSWRIYVHRELGEHPSGELFYAIQEDDGESDWYAPVDGSIDGKPTYKHESGSLDEPSEIVALYPYWGELAKRQIRRLQSGDREGAAQSLEAFPRDVPAVCNVCAYDAGGTWTGEDAWGIGGTCPLCREPGWVNPTTAWSGLPDALVEAAIAAHNLRPSEPPVEPEPALDADPALAAILALAIGERYVEERWGPSYVSAGEIRDGRYPTHDQRVVVKREADHDGTPRYSLRAECRWFDEEWKGDSLGFSRRTEDAFGMWTKAPALGTCLAALRALLDHEMRERETDEETLAERERYGITDEHLRTGTLSERTKAELAAQAEVAA